MQSVAVVGVCARPAGLALVNEVAELCGCGERGDFVRECVAILLLFGRYTRWADGYRATPCDCIMCAGVMWEPFLRVE